MIDGAVSTSGGPRGGRHARHSAAGSGRNYHLGRRIAIVATAIVSVTCLVGWGYAWAEYRNFNTGFHSEHLAVAPVTRAPSSTAADGKATKVDGVDENFLVVGMDTRDGISDELRKKLHLGSNASMSTDTIMVIHVPADGSRATMISIPRDSYVDIPGGYLKNKINAAYADAYTLQDPNGTPKVKQQNGANELIATVSQLTGLPINHYVQVGFGGFYKIAKAVKSIPVTLCGDVDDSFARHRLAGESGGSGFKMTAGRHDLTPVQAVEFVRQRHFLNGGDLSREKRQQYFMRAVFNEVATAGTLLNPLAVNDLIDAIHGAFYVDDNNFSIVKFAEQLSDLSAGNIKGHVIRTSDARVTIGTMTGQSVQLVDPVKVKAQIAKWLAAPATPKPTKSHTPGSSSPGSSTSSSPSSSSGSKVLPGCVN
jgi:LCP family protein required for cell wall assembly